MVNIVWQTKFEGNDLISLKRWVTDYDSLLIFIKKFNWVPKWVWMKIKALKNDLISWNFLL